MCKSKDDGKIYRYFWHGTIQKVNIINATVNSKDVILSRVKYYRLNRFVKSLNVEKKVRRPKDKIWG